LIYISSISLLIALFSLIILTLQTGNCYTKVIQQYVNKLHAIFSVYIDRKDTIMKKLLIILLVVFVAFSASAQFRGHGGYYYGPRVVIAGGYAPYSYYPFYAYPYPYGYYPHYRAGYRPSKLELQIDKIEYDYKEKKWLVKHDKSLQHKERRRQIRQLKHDRDQAIADAKLNYYRR
jgi:hypothetical protein